MNQKDFMRWRLDSREKILNEANILFNSDAKMPEAKLIPLRRRLEDSSLQTLMV